MKATIKFALSMACLSLSLSASGDCRRYALSPEPSWVFSGVESILPDGNATIVVADPAEGRLIRYREDEATNSMVGETQVVEYPPGFRIGLLQANADGYLLNDPRGTFLDLDQDFSVERSFNVLEVERPANTPELASVVQWSPYGNGLILFGDIAVTDQNWISGLVHVDPQEQDAPEALETIHKIAIGDAARRFFYLGQPLIATLDPGRSYFLSKEELFHLYQDLGTSARATSRTSVELSELTPIPESIKNSDVVGLFQRAAQTQGPAGIYPWKDPEGDALFVLERDHQVESGWSLRKLSVDDKGTLQDLGKKVLPTTEGQFLTIVPGARYWTLIERGPVRGWDNMTIASAWRISADHFREWKSDSATPQRLCGR